MDPPKARSALELQRGIGQPAEGDGEPEVDGAVGQHSRKGLTGGGAEAGDHRHQHELHHPEAPGRDGDGGQNVGQSVGHQEVHRGDEVAEGGHEDPEGRRIEQPVGRSPADGPPGEGPVLHQYREPCRQPFDQGRGPVGIEEADPARHPPDDPAGPLLTPGEEVEEAPEGAQQDHPHAGGHDDQDGGRLRLVAVVSSRDVEAVGDQEGHQRAPEHHVEHDRRPDALGPEGEAGIGPRNPRLGEQPVAECGPRSSPAGGNVAEGQRGHVDAEEPEAVGTVVGEHGVGQLGVSDEGADLEEDAEGQVAEVDVGQGVDLGAVAGQEGQGHVEEEEEHHQGAHAESDLAPHEWSPVPPPPPRPGRGLFLIASHPDHVGTPDPLGPDMLAW
jgi:hypothetical protein